MRQKILLLSLGAALAGSSVPAAAQSAFDWSGFYLGGSIGVVDSRSDAKIDYNSSDLSDPVGNWTDTNYFTGHVWHDVDGAWLQLDHGGGIDIDSNPLQLGDLLPWLTRTDISDLALSGTLQAGGQWQTGHLVLGAEIRGTFGDFGTGYSNQWSDGASDENSAAWCDWADCVARIRHDGFGPDEPTHSDWDGTSGWGPLIPSPQDVDFSGDLHQDNSLSFNTSYGSYFAPVFRAGLAADRWMFFAMGGPAVARVSASTEASVRERGDIDYGYWDGDYDRLGKDAEELYEWSGKNTKTLWGYTLGGGVEYAVTDNAILRVEGSFTDLGSIDVTGVSAQTDATYEVEQRVTNWYLGVGMNFKF